MPESSRSLAKTLYFGIVSIIIVSYTMIFNREGPLRRLLRERVQKGPLLKKLRDEIFKAATEILDSSSFDSRLLEDINNAKAIVLIFSPFLKLNKVELFLSSSMVSSAMERGVKIIVVTRLPKDTDNAKEHSKAIERLRNKGRLYDTLEK